MREEESVIISLYAGYTCGDYEFTFEIPDATDDPLTVLMTLTLSGGLTPDENPECDVDWGDGLTDNIAVDDPSVEQDHAFILVRVC